MPVTLDIADLPIGQTKSASETPALSQCWGLSAGKGLPAGDEGCLAEGHMPVHSWFQDSAAQVTWVSAPGARARVQFPEAGGAHAGVMDPLSPTQVPLPGSLLVWAGTQVPLIRPMVRQPPLVMKGPG